MKTETPITWEQLGTGLLWVISLIVLISGVIQIGKWLIVGTTFDDRFQQFANDYCSSLGSIGWMNSIPEGQQTLTIQCGKN